MLIAPRGSGSGESGPRSRCAETQRSPGSPLAASSFQGAPPLGSVARNSPESAKRSVVACPRASVQHDARAHLLGRAAEHREERVAGAELQRHGAPAADRGRALDGRRGDAVDDRDLAERAAAAERARAGERRAGPLRRAARVRGAGRQRVEPAIEPDDAELAAQHLADGGADGAGPAARGPHVPGGAAVGVRDVQAVQASAARDGLQLARDRAGGGGRDRVAAADDERRRGGHRREAERRQQADDQRPRGDAAAARGLCLSSARARARRPRDTRIRAVCSEMPSSSATSGYARSSTTRSRSASRWAAESRLRS
jgi:hypothetical protein